MKKRRFSPWLVSRSEYSSPLKTIRKRHIRTCSMYLRSPLVYACILGKYYVDLVVGDVSFYFPPSHGIFVLARWPFTFLCIRIPLLLCGTFICICLKKLQWLTIIFVHLSCYINICNFHCCFILYIWANGVGFVEKYNIFVEIKSCYVFLDILYQVSCSLETRLCKLLYMPIEYVRSTSLMSRIH
jgi:hypothetical protein